MTTAGAIRVGQAALLAATAAVGVAYWDFGWFEVAVAILGGCVLAATAELALAPRDPRPARALADRVRWNLPDLERAALLLDRGGVRDVQRARLLRKLAPFADELGYLPSDLDDLVRESLPELVA